MTDKPLIIDVEPEAPPAPKNICSNCKGGLFNKTNPMGECRMLPPQATTHLVPYRDPLSNMGGMRPQAYACWPPVRRDNFCLSWQPRETH